MVSVINDGVPVENTTAFGLTLQDGKFEFEVTSLDKAVVDEKIPLMLSTNQYPDIFFKNTQTLTANVVTKYGKQGVFIPLNDLIDEYAPNLSKALEERPAVRKAITDDDGNIYALPSMPSEQIADAPYWINTKWMDNLGLEMPTNMDELYTVLEAFKTEDANGNGDPNDEIPVMQSANPTTLVTSFLPYVGAKYDKRAHIIEKDGVVVDARGTEAYKESMMHCAKLYQNGLIDKNIFVQTVQQAQAIGQAGDVSGMTSGVTPVTYCGPINGDYFGALMPFYEKSYFVNPGVGTGAFVITDKCEQPEVAMAWIDQLYSHEGSLLSWLGVEGVSYEWVDEEKTAYEWIIPEGESIVTVRQKHAIAGTGGTATITPEVYYAGSPDEATRYFFAEKKNCLPYTEGYWPVFKYSDSDTKTLATIEADISAYADIYAGKVIVGELDLEESWDEYTAKLEDMGISRLNEIKQASYDANN